MVSYIMGHDLQFLYMWIYHYGLMYNFTWNRHDIFGFIAILAFDKFFTIDDYTIFLYKKTYIDFYRIG